MFIGLGFGIFWNQWGGGGSGPPPSSGNYITEDGSGNYIIESGAGNYITEAGAVGSTGQPIGLLLALTYA